MNPAENNLPDPEDAGPKRLNELFKRLMADPEIGMPGSWSMRYNDNRRCWELKALRAPGYKTNALPGLITKEVIRKNMARLFQKISDALTAEKTQKAYLRQLQKRLNKNERRSK